MLSLMATEEKTNETFLCRARDRGEADALRKHLLASMRRIWLFVYKHGNEFTLAANNDTGGKLSESMTIILRDSCKEFLDSYRGVTEAVEQLNNEWPIGQPIVGDDDPE